MITDKTIQTAISGAWLQTYLSLSNTPTNDSHVVVLYHGYSEHSSKYTHVMKMLNDAGLHVHDN